MKKRSRTGSKPVKARPRKALEPKGRSAPKALSHRGAAPARETEVARIIRERDEALEREAATADLLRVISQSAFNLQVVLDTLVQSAARLCEADMASLVHPEGSVYRFLASYGYPQRLIEFMETHPVHLGRGTITGRTVIEGKPIHVPDVLADPEFTFREGVKIAGLRTMLGVPLLRDGVPTGVFVLSRRAVRPFSDKQIELVQNFATQAVIAVENARVLNELRQRTADLTESLEQQTATANVLRVISSSSSDIQPVLDTIVRTAGELCASEYAALFRLKDGNYPAVAWNNAAAEWVKYYLEHPIISVDRGSLVGRTALERSAVHIVDCLADPEYAMHEAARLGRQRTMLGVPLLNNGTAIGVIGLLRTVVKPFTEKQIELVTAFADQAVIAIENARLLSELRESLQEQTATSEVLQVISSSPGDLQPVFAAMLEKAVRICDATFGNIYRWDGDALQLVATHNTPPAYAEHRKHSPFRAEQNNSVAQMITSKKVVHLLDAAANETYATRRDPTVVAAVELGGIRSALIVPMLKEGELVGAFIVSRQEVRPFAEKQIALVTNFAAQAVIAIENARLLNELRQRTTDLTASLEQQTATSDVLQVISSFPGDLQPVFDAMLEKAARICDATFGRIYRRDGDALHLVGTHNTPPAFAEAARKRSPIRPDPRRPVGRMLATKTTVHIADLAAEPMYAEERDPSFVAAVELGGIRTLLDVPMLKENELIGAIAIYRQVVLPFTDKQIELVQNFAAQAVIAIENARLLNELRQSLEQQTAMAEVLRVISSSPSELDPVFRIMLTSATRLCEANFGQLLLHQGDGHFRNVAMHNAPPSFVEFRKREPVVRVSGALALAATDKQLQFLHIPDCTEHAFYKRGDADFVKFVDLCEARTFLQVPLRRDQELLGVIGIYRKEVRPFADKQIALLKSFAAQAVIAIENARLLNELRQRTEEVEKLNQNLEQRVADQVGEIERMGRLRRFLPPQVADLIVASGSEKQLESHRRQITALFCDLRGFTGFTGSADAEDVMSLLRDYHAAVGEIIIKYSGTLERYAGDGVMVILNDPVPVENPALQAVLMALEMRDAIGPLTGKWRRLGHDIGFGIGIAHGFATLGTIGFEGRFDYAAIGTVSNVASRLCDEAKPGQILISPRVLMAVEDAVTVEPVGEFELKGIRRPITAYNVLAALAQTH
jgi:GAF domain-containing protein